MTNNLETDLSYTIETRPNGELDIPKGLKNHPGLHRVFLETIEQRSKVVMVRVCENNLTARLYASAYKVQASRISLLNNKMNIRPFKNIAITDDLTFSTISKKDTILLSKKMNTSLLNNYSTQWKKDTLFNYIINNNIDLSSQNAFQVLKKVFGNKDNNLMNHHGVFEFINRLSEHNSDILDLEVISSGQKVIILPAENTYINTGNNVDLVARNQKSYLSNNPKENISNEISSKFIDEIKRINLNPKNDSHHERKRLLEKIMNKQKYLAIQRERTENETLIPH